MFVTDIVNLLTEWLDGAPENRVPAEKALKPEFAGLRIYDDPLVGVCAADDSYLLSLADNDEANLHIITPEEWLPGAKSVIAVFFPLSERVRESNRDDGAVSLEWLHGRIEGQACAEAATRYLLKYIGSLPPMPGADRAPSAMTPAFDERYRIIKNDQEPPTRKYSANWSERHVAYAAGLGTFSMPGGLITRAGTAGRLGSIVTTLEIEPTPRDYEGLYDYCIQCEICVKRCPADAIHKDMTKNGERCSKQIDIPKAKYPPYYGCGKCQVAVPCEAAAPGVRSA